MAAFPEFYCEDIPALAGNTGSVPPARWRAWDHPRSRGEYKFNEAVNAVSGGSSPLSRGIRGTDTLTRTHVRIIPALAGNTFGRVEAVAGAGDHPRSRGKYWQRGEIEVGFGGSSPLSRGIPGCEYPENHRGGIIPALAGNTTDTMECSAPGSDHPRSRGEYLSGSSSLVEKRGSSPLSRGILRTIFIFSSRTRIIPALAGNTRTSHQGVRSCGDHPRSRGEYISGPGIAFSFPGSSPLSRGIRHWRWHGCLCPGIIPALAGNTKF